jgi:hypothetical protein
VILLIYNLQIYRVITNRNACNENEASYFSSSQKFDHSASNCFQHFPHESPKSEDFKGTNDEEEEYDGDKSIQ